MDRVSVALMHSFVRREGSFNGVALMDAANCFIFGMVLMPVDDAEPSQSEMRRLLKMGWALDFNFEVPREPVCVEALQG